MFMEDQQLIPNCMFGACQNAKRCGLYRKICFKVKKRKFVVVCWICSSIAVPYLYQFLRDKNTDAVVTWVPRSTGRPIKRVVTFTSRTKSQSKDGLGTLGRVLWP